MRREVWECEARRYTSGMVVVKGRAIGGAGPETVETSYTGRAVLAPGKIAKTIAGLLYATPGAITEVREGTGPDSKFRIIRAVMERG